MFIYIVEGPSGSGKSTMLIKQQVDWPGVLYIEGRSTQVRDYEGKSGLMEATLKDTRVAAAIVTCQADMVLLDRWILSSMVYDSLRGEAPLPRQIEFNRVMVGWLSVILGLQEQLRARGRPFPEDFQFNWKFNLPSYTEIKQRRIRNKVYPFDAGEELMAYRVIKGLLEGFIEEGLVSAPGIEFSSQDVTEGNWEW